MKYTKPIWEAYTPFHTQNKDALKQGSLCLKKAHNMIFFWHISPKASLFMDLKIYLNHMDKPNTNKLL